MSETDRTGGWGTVPGPGETEAWAARADELESEPGGMEEARAIHEWLLHVEGGRVDSVRALLRIGAALGSAPTVGAVADVLRLFDGRVVASRAPPLTAVPRPPDEALEAARPVGLAVLDEVFGVLLRSSPLFRGEAAGWPSQRVSAPDDLELYRAHAAAVRVLGLPGTPMFVRRGSGVEVAATDPPSIVVGDELMATSVEARFQLGRALEGTRPGRVLAVALGSDASSAIYDAVAMAFGPRTRERPTLSRGADALVKELWGLPPRVQRQLETLCADASLTWGAEVWRLLVRQAGNRAGLLVSGDAAASLALVVAESKALRDVDPTTEAGFRKASVESPEFADLVAFAVSQRYVSIRWAAAGGASG